jgi:hypothetical protein
VPMGWRERGASTTVMSSNCEDTVSYVWIDECGRLVKLTLAVWRARPTLTALARRAGMAMAAERSPFMLMVEVGVRLSR